MFHRWFAGRAGPPPRGCVVHILNAAVLPLQGTKIVTYHRSWVYLAHRFGLEVLSELEPNPGVPPTASHLVTVVEAAKAGGVKLIL